MERPTKDGLGEVMSLFSEDSVNDGDWMTEAECEPDRLLDSLSEKMQRHGDLVRLHKLYVLQMVVRLLRDEQYAMTPSMLLAIINEATGIAMEELRELLFSESRGG
jgi:hypothetical protein